MTKKKKIITIATISVFLIVIFTAKILSNSILCKKIDIVFLDDNNSRFVDEKDIKNIIFQEYPDIFNTKINTINVALLENKIKNDPSIIKADVFTKIDGVLGVKIKQRTPIVRVINSENQSFYIDKEGILMPLSKNKSSHVIVVNGNIKDKFTGKKQNVNTDTTFTKLKDIFNIVKQISASEFMTAQIEQIYINSKNEYELIPRVGPHTVLFGSPENYKQKLTNLEIFYTKTLNTEGWNKYKHINLKFENQIVCTKR